MTAPVEVAFASFPSSLGQAPVSPEATAPASRVLVVFLGADLAFGPETAALLGEGAAAALAAARAARFKAKAGAVFDQHAPSGLPYDRLMVVGAGQAGDKEPVESVQLGGTILGKLGHGAQALVLFEPAPLAGDAAAAADMLLGMKLRAYRFDAYKTKIKEEDKPVPIAVTIAVPDPDAARREAIGREAAARGVATARTLVNEPPNVLFPAAFAERAEKLRDLGVEVEVLDVAAMRALGMGALLGVGQGSARESRVVIMRWRGGGAPDAKPVAFIGKGVTFDTGGISIKPAAGMEDMKGDMAGAACVVGLMETLAIRKARVDAVGAIGLVENMPDGAAQRPGDIVTSLSGQTIEIINTDAEGRLVLADVCWYVQDRFKPLFMVDLATLTGAILIALGQEYAGLFSNNDELSERLFKAGTETGEKVWRLPMGPAYDKMIDSKFADMKNTGGRHGGSISAAHFIGRFVNDVPWAHLDIAGVGMASNLNEINQSWGSGWGVRLLDRLVADHYEG